MHHDQRTAVTNHSLGTSSRWESAYAAFETPEEEQRKFIGRLSRLGVRSWDRQSRVLEVCSGRGNGVRAWRALGFARVVGVDISPAFLASYGGHSIRGDARALPLCSDDFDIAVVQGGLHHLSSRDDVGHALAEMARVVVPGGRLIIIEPWSTPFLTFAHSVCRNPLMRRVWPKADALTTMIDEEGATYKRWLSTPTELMALIRTHVRPRLLVTRRGKLTVLGAPIKK